MNENLSRALLCLAAMDLSSYELKRLIDELASIPVEELVSRVSEIQQLARARKHSTDRQAASLGHDVRDDSVAARTYKLLRIEAHLSSAEAVRLLTERLVQTGFLKKNDVPALSKKSLHDWVAKVAQRVPAKEVLRLATVIRNERVHGPVPDWTLSRVDK